MLTSFMKTKTNKSPYLLLRCTLLLLATAPAIAINITRVEPANWWVGMKNTNLQVMVYGPNISKAKLSINYAGIRIKEVAKTANPNYLFIYLTIAKGTKPGHVPFVFTEGQQKFTYRYP